MSINLNQSLTSTKISRQENTAQLTDQFNTAKQNSQKVAVWPVVALGAWMVSEAVPLAVIAVGAAGTALKWNEIIKFFDDLFSGRLINGTDEQRAQASKAAKAVLKMNSAHSLPIGVRQNLQAQANMMQANTGDKDKPKANSAANTGTQSQVATCTTRVVKTPTGIVAITSGWQGKKHLESATHAFVWRRPISNEVFSVGLNINSAYSLPYSKLAMPFEAPERGYENRLHQYKVGGTCELLNGVPMQSTVTPDQLPSPY